MQNINNIFKRYHLPDYRLVYVFFTLVIFYLIVFDDHYTYDSFKHSNAHFFISGCIVSLLLLLFFSQHQILRVTQIDLLFLLYFFVIIVSRIFQDNISPYNSGLACFIYVSLIFFIIRISFRSNWIMWLFLTGVSVNYFVQLVMIVKQFSLYVNYSQETALAVQGTLDNSGLCAGYMVISAPLLLYNLKKINNKRLSGVLILFLVSSLLFVIIISRSRAALLSSIVVALFIVRTYHLNFVKRLSVMKKHFVLLSLIALTGLVVILFQVKKNSAEGRMLVWKISSGNYLNNPFWGIGYSEFPSIYPVWQATYFQNYTGPEKYKSVADLPTTAFNEYLQILIETGIVGLAVFLLLVTLLFRQKVHEKDSMLYETLKSVMACILVFAFFSYPLHSTPILCVFIISAACISNLAIKQITFRIFPTALKACCITSVLICIYSVNYFNKKRLALSRWQDLRFMMLSEGKADFDLYQKIYPFLNNETGFLSDYGNALFEFEKYNESILLLEESKRKRITLETLLALGAAYEKVKDYSRAEQNFQLAADMIPNRFRPRYLLCKIYLKTGDSLKARSIAEEIVKMPVKVPSFEVDEIRNEMNWLLSK